MFTQHHEHGVALVGMALQLALLTVSVVLAAGVRATHRSVVRAPGQAVRTRGGSDAFRVLDAQLVLVDLERPVPSNGHVADLAIALELIFRSLAPVWVEPVAARIILHLRLRL